MSRIQAFTQELTTAFQKALTADSKTEHPTVQLSDDEIASLVAFLQRIAVGVQPTKAEKKGRVRARSTYQIWKSDDAVKEAFRTKHPGSDGPTTNKLMGDMWKALSDEEKAPFEATHEAELAEYDTGETKTK